MGFFKNKVFSALGTLIAVVALIVAGIIFQGYVLSVLWGWFIVPTFGAPALGLVPAIGISIVVIYLVYWPDQHRKDREETTMDTEIMRAGMAILLKPAAALLAGWIVQMFM